MNKPIAGTIPPSEDRCNTNRDYLLLYRRCVQKTLQPDIEVASVVHVRTLQRSQSPAFASVHKTAGGPALSVPCYPAAHECESDYTDTERFRHRGELRLVWEVGLEKVLGLGNAADFRGGGVGGMRDLSLPRGTREPRQGGERVHVWTRWRRNGRQGRLDVGVGGGC